MIETTFVRDALGLALLILALAVLVVLWRLWRCESAADRLLTVDMLTSLLINISIVVALLEGTDAVIDVAIILAAIGFAGTLSIARYISEGRVF